MLKEPILQKEENVPWLCPTGQYQHIRPYFIYQDLIYLYFKVIKWQDYNDRRLECDQRMWLLKSKV